MPPRRQRGEGSVFQRQDGRWCGSFEVRTPAGRRRKYVYGKTQRDALTKLRAARREYERTGALSANLTVEAWLTHWLDGLEQDNAVKTSTLDHGYRSKMAHVSRVTGRRRLDRVEPDHVREVYRTLAAEGRAKSYIVQTHRILSRALKEAYLEGKAGRNVMELVKTPKVGSAAVKTRYMTAAEVLAVINALAGDRLASRWLFQITLGARQGEVLGLGWEDVDLDVATVTITRALQRQTGKGLTFVDPKSETSHRSLPLPPLLLAALRSRHDVWLSEGRAELSGEYAPFAVVWGNLDGRPRDPKRDRDEWRALLRRAGVDESYGTHSARHGLATLLSQRGEPVKVVQAIMGHADPSMTMHYTHTDDPAQRKALEGAEAAMWGR